MVAPNTQAVVGNKRLVVQAVPNTTTFAVFIEHRGPSKIDIEPLLKGGLDERQALEWVMEIVKIAVVGGAA